MQERAFVRNDDSPASASREARQPRVKREAPIEDGSSGRCSRYPVEPVAWRERSRSFPSERAAQASPACPASV